MNVLLIGAGAVGAFYASKIPCKHTVSVVCRSNYSVVKENGFEIHSRDSTVSVFKPFAVYSSLDQCTGNYDLIIIATKADQFIDLDAFADSKPIILIIQNGLGVEDLYAEKYPNLCILSAVTVISCAQVRPGVIMHYSWTRIHIGPFTNSNQELGMKYAKEIVNRLMLWSMPWHFVGWGGGGSAILYLANNHTSSIQSVTFFETYPPKIEFSYYGYQNGLSQQAISEYRSAQISSRIGLVQLILSMAIPWGLMGLFIPISPQHEGCYPPERLS